MFFHYVFIRSYNGLQILVMVRICRWVFSKRVSSRVNCQLQQVQNFTQKKCFIVGAGIGGIDYLTVKGFHLLQTADVIVYDDLGTKEILQVARTDSSQIYVGKRGGRKSAIQEDINAILLQQCKPGKMVVRLKGGCPSVFARLNSELSALRQAGVQVEIVPGISSVLAAPLMAGFSLTDATTSKNFLVVSGHSKESLDWNAIKHADTVIFLMAGQQIDYISSQLKEQCDRQEDCPVVIIKRCGLQSEQIWWGNVGSITTQVGGVDLSPCILLVGGACKHHYGVIN
eukprot:TRINITY_DN9044_c1_g4_i4.p1 TRINITY_DN9044_c1_g4~~TRINITY_DN9044_c1_g4_i4.p1  ORF type:complete len:302 (-),score=7.20 TRINITY_DN9044_c1_g4_i4:213-1067(-)